MKSGGVVRSQNYQELKDWVGDIPDHGAALGLQATVVDTCRLLSARSVDDVSIMLDLMASTAEKLADDGAYRHPPLGRGWVLHGTGLWRVISATVTRKKARALKCEPWECVAAMALHCARRAKQALQRDPVGIGLHPRMAGEDAQKWAAHAASWLRHACSEKDSIDVAVGRNLRAGQSERAARKGDAWRAEACRRFQEFGDAPPSYADCGRRWGEEFFSDEDGKRCQFPSVDTIKTYLSKAKKAGLI